MMKRQKRVVKKLKKNHQKNKRLQKTKIGIGEKNSVLKVTMMKRQQENYHKNKIKPIKRQMATVIVL